ncbi:MAG: D-sedoheptulose-7-phosphate isomerase [Thermodesulfobacteriota bacterium]
MYRKALQEHLDCFARLGSLENVVQEVGRRLAGAIQSGGKILICGNGGSAADAQHFAAEIIGRFEKERAAWPAVALTTDTSILTAVGNDYGFADIFSRQVQGLGRPGDALIGISTSGESANVIRAVSMARETGIFTVGLLGRTGGRLAALVDASVVIPARTTARIQEAHGFILHFWAGAIEQMLTSSSENPEP